MAAHAHTADFIWEPHRELTLKAARRRSRIVERLRRVFVAGAGAAFASVFVFLGINSAGGPPEPAAVNEPLRMVNPRFTGRSAADGAFQVTAAYAERGRTADEPIVLVAPVFRSENGRVLAAPRGLYDVEANRILFEGDVIISQPSGLRLRASNMTLDLETGRLRGQRVTGMAPAR